MSKARFEVQAFFDHANKLQDGSVTIDRDSGLFSVRIKGRHKEYVVPLSDVADMVYKKAVMQEANEDRPKRRRRVMSRGLLTVGR